MQQKKRVYQAPELIIHGTLETITKGQGVKASDVPLGDSGA